MNTDTSSRPSTAARIGFTCAYTPLPLIRAAGFVPHRLLPLGDAPDRAGAVLHDNMCPHVKRILDRALAGGFPDLAGVVVMNSCDAMRRLADAWRALGLSDRLAVVELPAAMNELSTAFLASELTRLRDRLADWAGDPIEDWQILEATRSYDRLTRSLTDAYARASSGRGGGRGSRVALQALMNRSVTEPVETSLQCVEDYLTECRRSEGDDLDSAVPLFLFGNVMADPESFAVFERCGGRVVGDDLCTGGRQLAGWSIDAEDALFPQLARAVLGRPLCARTLAGVPGDRDRLAEQVLAGARASGARGVVAHVMKFCDPYLARMPAVARRLEQDGMPLLVLEGDCTTRSLGQQATRIEAFVEMLGGV